MKTRKEVPVEFTWDLTDMFATEADWEDSLKDIRNLTDQVLAYKGNVIANARNLYKSLVIVDQISILISRAYSYAKMILDTDMSNQESKARFERIDALNTWVSGTLSFYEPEIAQIDEDTYNAFKLDESRLSVYDHKFEKLFKHKPFILSPEMEALLSKMSSLGSSFRKVYDDIAINDLSFPEIEGHNGERMVANETNYRKALHSEDRGLRERFFKGLLSTYSTHVNSITSTYAGSVKYDVFTAKTRTYPSARAMAMDRNFIPEQVYDNLLDTVRKGAYHLHAYIDLRKRALGVDAIHFYDLFNPVVEEIQKEYTYEEAQELVIHALSILGEDYIDVLRRAFRERWIDVYPNKGKVTGAYATGSYGVHPYSLLNFTGTLDDVFTLAHELGHVMHRYYSVENQPYVNAQYTIFTAEVASTVNESLLLQYLLKHTTDEKEKALLLSMHLDNIRSTFYRQTMFADFEYQVHHMLESDTPITPKALCELYEDLYKVYYGPEFVIDEELKYEWCRIPHFYRAFYVYQYATGISAAISLSDQILKEGKPAVERYRKFLTTGGSDFSINLLKVAGVDMSSPQPVQDTLNNFARTTKELANLIL